MKKLFIILIITFFGCDSQDNIIGPKFNANKAIDFSVYNSKGEDLFNPQSTDHIDYSKIKLFYVVNGVTNEFFQENLAYPRNIMLYQNQNEFRIEIIMNDSEKNGKSVTYIQWNEKDTDTIEATYIRDKNFIYSKDVWLNGTLVSGDVKLGESPYVRLIK